MPPRKPQDVLWTKLHSPPDDLWDDPSVRKPEGTGSLG
jgi:hypothetical protein